MKTTLLTLSLSSSLLLAHGSLPKQAADATQVAANLFTATESKEITKSFKSVTATMTGHEKVRVQLTTELGERLYTYDCAEDENESPVIWECEAK